MSQLAFVFPGQGSQKIGMLAEASEAFPIIKEVFAEASEAVAYDMWELIQNGEQADINLTEKTQPILLTASVALWRVWQALGGAQPALMAGHSLGEFSALVCSGSLDFADAVRLVRSRGQFMQTAVPVGVGAMAAIIGVEDELINRICAEVAEGQCVQAVNYNSPGQVVIAGHVEGVERAMAELKAAGAKRALPLPVSAPFHTDLMQPAGEKLALELEALTLKSPQIPVIHNVHAQTESDPANIKALLVEQISSPVRWTSCVQFMVEHGIGQTIECGPGKVLSGLNKRIHKPLTCSAIEQSEQLQDVLAALTV